jgi:uncharacterized protein (UPF0333 family)
MCTECTAFLTIPAILLAAIITISFVITEDAFARDGRYTGDTTSQAASVSNECLNPIFDSNTIDNVVGVGNCGGTISQQDESGSASAPITSQTANPIIELQRATTTQPPDTGTPPQTCEECFDVLNDAQQAAFEQSLLLDPLPSPPFQSGITTIEQLCEAYKDFSAAQRAETQVFETIQGALEFADVVPATIQSILVCLQNSVG